MLLNPTLPSACSLSIHKCLPEQSGTIIGADERADETTAIVSEDSLRGLSYPELTDSECSSESKAAVERSCCLSSYSSSHPSLNDHVNSRQPNAQHPQHFNSHRTNTRCREGKGTTFVRNCTSTSTSKRVPSHTRRSRAPQPSQLVRELQMGPHMSCWDPTIQRK